MTTFELIDSNLTNNRLIAVLRLVIRVYEQSYRDDFMILNIVRFSNNKYSLLFNDRSHIFCNSISNIMSVLRKLKFSKDILLTIQGELLKLL